MRRIIVSESIAVDGVFEAETMGQWAVPFFSEEREEFIRGLVLTVDALLLGRTTYDIQAWYWPNQKADKYGIAKRSLNRYGRFPYSRFIGRKIHEDSDLASISFTLLLSCI